MAINASMASAASLAKLGEQLGEKLDELIAGQKQGAPVEVAVDIDSGRSAANIAMKQRGI